VNLDVAAAKGLAVAVDQCPADRVEHIELHAVGRARLAVIEHMDEEAVSARAIQPAKARKEAFVTVRGIHPVQRSALEIVRARVVLELKVAANIAVAQHLRHKAHRVLSAARVVPTTAGDVPRRIRPHRADDRHRFVAERDAVERAGSRDRVGLIYGREPGGGDGSAGVRNQVKGRNGLVTCRGDGDRDLVSPVNHRARKRDHIRGEHGGRHGLTATGSTAASANRTDSDGLAERCGDNEGKNANGLHDEKSIPHICASHLSEDYRGLFLLQAFTPRFRCAIDPTRLAHPILRWVLGHCGAEPGRSAPHASRRATPCAAETTPDGRR